MISFIPQSIFSFALFTLYIFVLSKLTFLMSKYVYKKTIQDFFDFGVCFFLTLLIIVFIYSIYYTKFKTSNSILIILIGIFIWQYQDRGEVSDFSFWNNKLNWFEAFLMALVSFIYFELWNYGIILTGGGIVFEDLYFYSLISKGLTDFGIENWYHSYSLLNKDFRQYNGYHYTEMWINNILYHFSPYNFNRTFLSFTFPSVFFIVLCFLIGFTKKLNSRKSFLVTLIAIFVLDGMVLKSSGIKNIFGGYYSGIYFTSIHEFKICFLFVGLTGLLYFFVLKKNYILAQSFISFFAIISYLNIPLVLFAQFLCLLFILLNKENKIKIALSTLMISLTLLTFYIGIDESVENIQKISFANIFSNVLNKTVFIKIIKLIVLHLMSLTMFIPLIYYSFNKMKHYVILLFSFLTVSLIVYYILYEVYNSSQIFTSTSMVVLFLCVFLSFAVSNKKLSFIYLILFLILKLVSLNYLLKIDENNPISFELKHDKQSYVNIKLENTKLIPVYRKYESYKFNDEKFFIHYKKPFIFFDCYEVLANNDHLYPVSISDFLVFKNQGTLKNQYIDFMKNGSVLFAFAKNNGWNVNETNADSILYKFMKYHKFDKVLHKNDVNLPSTLLAKEKICDSNGNCLTILK